MFNFAGSSVILGDTIWHFYYISTYGLLLIAVLWTLSIANAELTCLELWEATAPVKLAIFVPIEPEGKNIWSHTKSMHTFYILFYKHSHYWLFFFFFFFFEHLKHKIYLGKKKIIDHLICKRCLMLQREPRELMMMIWKNMKMIW